MPHGATRRPPPVFQPRGGPSTPTSGFPQASSAASVVAVPTFSRAPPLDSVTSSAPDLEFAHDSALEEARFEPSVPLWLGAFTRSKTSMSGPVGVGGFEEGEFEGDGPLEKVAAQILLRGADAVQLRAQEIDEAAKSRIVVQRDPLGVHEIDWQRLRRAGRPVEIEPFRPRRG